MQLVPAVASGLAGHRTGVTVSVQHHPTGVDVYVHAALWRVSGWWRRRLTCRGPTNYQATKDHCQLQPTARLCHLACVVLHATPRLPVAARAMGALTGVAKLAGLTLSHACSACITAAAHWWISCPLCWWVVSSWGDVKLPAPLSGLLGSTCLAQHGAAVRDVVDLRQPPTSRCFCQRRSRSVCLADATSPSHQVACRG